MSSQSRNQRHSSQKNGSSPGSNRDIMSNIRLLRRQLDHVILVSNKNAQVFQACLSALEAGQAVTQKVLNELARGDAVTLIEVEGKRVIHFQSYLEELKRTLDQEKEKVEARLAQVDEDMPEGATVFGGTG